VRKGEKNDRAYRNNDDEQKKHPRKVSRSAQRVRDEGKCEETESPTGNVFGHSYRSGTPALKQAVDNGKKERRLVSLLNIMDPGPAARDFPDPL
jgi:hypothetical protein